MKRISYSSLALLVLSVAFVAVAFAADGRDCTPPVNTPLPNSAVMDLKIWGDCGSSNLTYGNNYPSNIWIRDRDVDCYGWTNRHAWSFSEDGLTKAVFENCSHYRFSATFNMHNYGGVGNAEGGLRISPHWSPVVDGTLMVRTDDGMIECWGGLLPYYNFTAAHGIHYVAGVPIWIEVAYNPHSLTEADPATARYTVHYQGQTYTSGELAYGSGNPTEDPPHGLWGELYPAYAGGFFMAPKGSGGAAWDWEASWWDIQYYHDYWATPSKNATWGQLKTLYR